MPPSTAVTISGFETQFPVDTVKAWETDKDNSLEPYQNVGQQPGRQSVAHTNPQNMIYDFTTGSFTNDFTRTRATDLPITSDGMEGTYAPELNYANALDSFGYDPWSSHGYPSADFMAAKDPAGLGTGDFDTL